LLSEEQTKSLETRKARVRSKEESETLLKRSDECCQSEPIPPFALWVASFQKSGTSQSKIKSGSLEVYTSSNHTGKHNAHEPYAMFLPVERIHKPFTYMQTGKSVPVSSRKKPEAQQLVSFVFQGMRAMLRHAVYCEIVLSSTYVV
jgi:hypothetical protein